MTDEEKSKNRDNPTSQNKREAIVHIFSARIVQTKDGISLEALSSEANLDAQMKILSFEQRSQLFSAAVHALSEGGCIPNLGGSEKMQIPDPIGILTGKKSIPWKLQATAPDGGGRAGCMFCETRCSDTCTTVCWCGYCL